MIDSDQSGEYFGLSKVHVEGERWPLAMITIAELVQPEWLLLDVFVADCSSQDLVLNRRYGLPSTLSIEQLNEIAQVACQRELSDKFAEVSLPVIEPTSIDWVVAVRTFGMYPAIASTANKTAGNKAYEFCRKLRGSRISIQG